MVELPFGDNPFANTSTDAEEQATPLNVDVPQSSQLCPPPRTEKEKPHRKRGHGVAIQGGNKDDSKKGRLTETEESPSSLATLFGDLAITTLKKKM